MIPGARTVPGARTRYRTPCPARFRARLRFLFYYRQSNVELVCRSLLSSGPRFAKCFSVVCLEGNKLRAFSRAYFDYIDYFCILVTDIASVTAIWFSTWNTVVALSVLFWSIWNRKLISEIRLCLQASDCPKSFSEVFNWAGSKIVRHRVVGSHSSVWHFD